MGPQTGEKAMRAQRVEAVVKPFKLEDLKPALDVSGIKRLAAVEARDSAAKKQHLGPAKGY